MKEKYGLTDAEVFDAHEKMLGRTIELITAVYKAGSTGLAVELPLKKEDPFYTVDGLMKSVPHFYEKTIEAAELSGEITLGSGYGAREEK